MILGHTINSLSSLFDAINQRYFEGALPMPVLAVQKNERRKATAYGWCTCAPVWNNKEGTDARYEITICAEYADRTIEEITGTMIHEMVHLYCSLNGIKDVSRNGSYHNKKFKYEAEKRGLIIGFVKSIGHSPTTLQESTKAWVHSLTITEEFFQYSRAGKLTSEKGTDPGTEGGAGKKKSSRRYVCPCGNIVRATKELFIICGVCKQPYVEASKSAGDDE